MNAILNSEKTRLEMEVEAGHCLISTKWRTIGSRISLLRRVARRVALMGLHSGSECTGSTKEGESSERLSHLTTCQDANEGSKTSCLDQARVSQETQPGSRKRQTRVVVVGVQ